MKVGATKKTIEIVSIAVLRAGTPVVIAVEFVTLQVGTLRWLEKNAPSTQGNVLEWVPRICAQFWVLQKTPILLASIKRYIHRTLEFTRRRLIRVICLPESSREKSKLSTLFAIRKSQDVFGLFRIAFHHPCYQHSKHEDLFRYSLLSGNFFVSRNRVCTRLETVVDE